MGAILLAAGAPGERRALSNARIMLHQPLGGFEGQATDVDIYAQEILKTRERLDALMAKHTGQTAAQIHKDTDRDRYLSPVEAKAYGIIDSVISPNRAPTARGERLASVRSHGGDRPR